MNAMAAVKDDAYRRLADVELRYESALRDCAALRGEVDRLASLMQKQSGSGDAELSLGNNKRSKENIEGEQGRGFVPFRSIKSYENLLSLQQMQRAKNAEDAAAAVQQDNDNDNDIGDQDDE